jgi:hypothetical protein
MSGTGFDPRAAERDGEWLLDLARDLEREGCPCGQRLPRCGHLIALAKAAAFFCEAPRIWEQRAGAVDE